jgi:CRP-like cAMP-binding protein
MTMRDYLESSVGILKDEDWFLIENIIETKKYPRSEFMLSEGERCRTIWYLSEGSVRYFEIIKGREVTTHFFTAPAFFTAYHSLITGSVSDLYIITNETCRIQAFAYSKLFELYDKSHKIERIGRVMAELQFIAEFDRRRKHLSYDAAEHYAYIESNRPDILQRFQQKDIASYLGITPESLSRLRKYRYEK